MGKPTPEHPLSLFDRCWNAPLSLWTERPNAAQRHPVGYRVVPSKALPFSANNSPNVEWEVTHVAGITVHQNPCVRLWPLLLYAYPLVHGFLGSHFKWRSMNASEILTSSSTSIGVTIACVPPHRLHRRTLGCVEKSHTHQSMLLCLFFMAHLVLGIHTPWSVCSTSTHSMPCAVLIHMAHGCRLLDGLAYIVCYVPLSRHQLISFYFFN